MGASRLSESYSRSFSSPESLLLANTENGVAVALYKPIGAN